VRFLVELSSQATDGGRLYLLSRGAPRPLVNSVAVEVPAKPEQGSIAGVRMDQIVFELFQRRDMPENRKKVRRWQRSARFDTKIAGARRNHGNGRWETDCKRSRTRLQRRMVRNKKKQANSARSLASGMAQ